MARKPDFEGGREERRNRGREVRKEGNLKIYLPTFFFFFFCSSGVLIQDLALGRQALYQLNHVPSSFCFSYFSDRVSLSPAFCLVLASHPDSPTYASGVGGITSTYHHTWLIC
jgi:hypothetical protein